MKLTWLIVDDTPLGASIQVCDFLCVQVIKPLFSLLQLSALRVGFAFSESLLQFLCEEETEMFAQLQDFVHNGTIELVIPLSFPSHFLSKEMLGTHIQQKNSLYQRVFGVSSRVLLPFGLSFDARIISVLREWNIDTIFVNKKSMNACVGMASHMGDQIHALGVDAELSRLSEEGPPKEFFIHLRDVAKSHHNSVVACTRLHHIGLALGSFERCWNKGLMKTIGMGIQQAQKWLKLVLPSQHTLKVSVTPIDGYFPLHYSQVMSWKSQFVFAPELRTLWGQLISLSKESLNIDQRYILAQAQEGNVFISHPYGWLEDMLLRHDMWLLISSIREDLIVPTIQQEDRDCDGYDELYIRSAIGDILCQPVLGACITMIVIPGVGNINNVLTRRYQEWHRQISSDPRLPMLVGDDFVPSGLLPQNPYFYNKLGYDRHQRGLFADVLYDHDVQLYKLRRGIARILHVCSQASYRVLSVEERKDAVYVDMEAQFTVHAQKGTRSLTVQKLYTFFYDEPKIRVTYTVENNSLEPLVSIWGVEMNLGLGNVLRPNMLFHVAPNPVSCSFLQAGHRKRSTGVQWTFSEGIFRGEISEPCEIFFYPVEVPVAQPTYIDMGYQGHCAMFAVPLDLWAGEQKSWHIECDWERE